MKIENSFNINYKLKKLNIFILINTINKYLNNLHLTKDICLNDNKRPI